MVSCVWENLQMAPQEVFSGYPTNFQQKFSHGFAFSFLQCMLSSTVFQLIDSPDQMLVFAQISLWDVSWIHSVFVQLAIPAVNSDMSIQVHFNDTDVFHWNWHMSFRQFFMFSLTVGSFGCMFCLRHFVSYWSLRHGWAGWRVLWGTSLGPRASEMGGTVFRTGPSSIASRK